MKLLRLTLQLYVFLLMILFSAPVVFASEATKTASVIIPAPTTSDTTHDSASVVTQPTASTIISEPEANASVILPAPSETFEAPAATTNTHTTEENEIEIIQAPIQTD